MAPPKSTPKSGDKKKKSAGKKEKKGRKHKGDAGYRRPKTSFSVHIHRVLKLGNKSKLTISSKSMKIFNSFVKDMFERLATEAAALARSVGRQTLSSKDVQTAVRVTLPAELAKHAMAEATKAVAKLASK